MAKDAEVFEVTRAQVTRWDYDNYLGFWLTLDEGEPELLVSAGIERTGVDRTGWVVSATSHRDAAEEVEYWNEDALYDAADGLKHALEYEAWRVVDMPENGITYNVDADKLIELGRVADKLELFCASQMYQYDPRRLINADGSIVREEVRDELLGAMQAVVDIRKLIGEMVRG